MSTTTALDSTATVTWPGADGTPQFGYRLSPDAPELDGVTVPLGHTPVLTSHGVRSVMTVAVRPAGHSAAALRLMRRLVDDVDGDGVTRSDDDVRWVVMDLWPRGVAGFLRAHVAAGLLHPSDAR